MKKQLSFLLLIAVLFSLFGCGSRSQRNSFNSSEPIVWDEILLKDYLPEPDKTDGKIKINYSDSVHFSFIDEDGSIFKSYVEKCKQFGYTIEPEADDNSYEAYDKNGYKLRMIHYPSFKETNVYLDAPDEMTAISLPTIGPASKLPDIDSNLGKISSDSSTTFSAYFANMSLEKYNDYLTKCQNKGFTVDYKKYDKSYSADNSEGYSLSLSYEGFNIIYVSIKTPEDSKDDSESPSDNENNDSNTPIGFNWENAGEGSGTVVPEPTMKYEINHSSDYISVKVHDATESDFYSYVSSCENSGFEGNVSTAISPDIYFMAEHSDGYELEVFFYEEDEYFSIYAAPKSN